ncbi:replication-relaxation family protein [Allorhizocola rhizosphaerae]|uniref:replication-relaxation family protein n=1 Tax=Allorhizocola rhizosphaerae TaxID=1872709 RepID=UPI000E3D4AF6|nr:replication-relaxation family protein [Allorhizocola rhizosphaerae]
MTLTRSAHGLLAIYPHITSRDRKILQLLDDHQVLTTDHITRLFFHSPRTCRHRLSELLGLGLLDRFRFARPGGGTDPYHWVLGHEGQRFQAAARGEAEPTARASSQHIARLSANPRLQHLLTVNEFFVRLAEHDRWHPAATLVRWWSEAAIKPFQTRILVRPDGHGLWTVGERTVGFWLEADTGSEPLTRVIAKLETYRKVPANGGPRYPVLFWLASSTREEHLHRLLRTEYADVLTATATHDTNPAEAVWLPGDGHDRVRLEQLPTFHGPPGADNPNYSNGVLVLGPKPAS